MVSLRLGEGGPGLHAQSAPAGAGPGRPGGADSSTTYIETER